jgi:hypothetical protein
METEASENVKLSPTADFFSHPLGEGTLGPRCGKLVTMGHNKGNGFWDVESHVYTCRRAECPRCYKLPGGYLDQAQTRIEAGILKGKTAAQMERVAEYVVGFQTSDEFAFLDRNWRLEVIKRVRRALEPATVPPGAYILHWRPQNAPDYCPQAPHLHVFIETVPGAAPVGEEIHDAYGKPFEYRRLDDTLTIRRMAIPEVRVALRVMGRVGYTSGMRGRARYVTLVGWFGRRGIGKKSEWQKEIERDLKESRTVLCPVCKKNVPRKDWSAVSMRHLKPAEPGSWEVPEAQVVPIEHGWRGG